MKQEQEQLEEAKFINVPLNFTLKKQFNQEELKFKYITSLNEINSHFQPLNLPPIGNKYRSANTPIINKKQSQLYKESQSKDRRLLNASQYTKARNTQQINPFNLEHQSLKISNFSLQMNKHQKSSSMCSQMSISESFKQSINSEQLNFNEETLEQEKKFKLNILYQDQEYEQIKEIKKKLEEEKSKFEIYIEDLDNQYEQKKARNSNEIVEEKIQVIEYQIPENKYSLYDKKTNIIKLNKQLHIVQRKMKQFIAYEKKRQENSLIDRLILKQLQVAFCYLKFS